MDSVVLGESGHPERSTTPHDLRVVASQDCDRDRVESYSPDPVVELRPLFIQDSPTDWGIRSPKLRGADHEYAAANALRLTVAPNVLTTALASGATRREVSFPRRQGFTTWLGLRYDRPAVPDHLVPLAPCISTEVARATHRDIGARVRDILMQFDATGEPIRYSLLAILEDAANEADVRTWLGRISQAVPTELGVAGRTEAADANGIAFSTIESSYAADVSHVTWRRDQPGAEGAT